MEPKLRFKEFSGDWEEDIIKNTIFLRNEKYNPQKSDIDYKCIELEHLSQETGQIIGSVSALKQKSIKNVFYKDDVLYGKLRPYLKKYAYCQFKGVCSSEIWVLNSNIINNKLLFYYIQTDRFQNVANISSGTKMPRADWNKIKLEKIIFPSLPEQTKIADFLSTVDEKIQNQQDKITHLENIKKGFMQQIFSRKIRFKDANGNEFPEWEEKKLGEISKVTTGNSNVDDNIVNGKYRFFDRGLDSINYLNEYFLDAEAIIYPGEGSKFMPRYYNGKFALHQRCYAIYDMSHSINVKYVFYYMQTLNKYFLRTSVGTTVPSLRQSNFEKCKIEVPCLEEQQKIADLLSSFDEKVDAEKETLEHLKELKKGLLQQMFV